MMYQKLFIIIAVFVAVAGSLVLVFVKPAFEVIGKISGDIAVQKAKLIFSEEQDAALNSFAGKYATYGDNLEAANRLFVDKANPIKVIEFMEAAAAEAQVTTDIGLSVVADKNTSGPPMIFFNVAAEGNFSGITAFSESLESGPYLISIQKATIRKLSADQEEVPAGALEADFLLTVIAK